MSMQIGPVTGQRFKVRRPFDYHVHFRVGDLLRTVVPYTASVYAGAIIMPNIGGKGKPHVYGYKEAEAYRDEILFALEKSKCDRFLPLLTIYLTDNTKPDDVIKAFEAGYVVAVKYYPAGATTNSDEGVTDITKCKDCLKALAEVGIPLLIHGEVPNMNEREVWLWEGDFMKNVLPWIIQNIPGLKISLEHISTKAAVVALRKYRAAGINIQANTTPQHVIYHINHLIGNGIRPHHYCKPVLKPLEDWNWLRRMILTDNLPIFSGTDSAPHTKFNKLCDCGCAGCFTPHSLELYAHFFGDLLATPQGQNRFEIFVSKGGLDFYPGLEASLLQTGLANDMIEFEYVENMTEPKPVRVGLSEEAIVPLPSPHVGKPGWKLVH